MKARRNRTHRLVAELFWRHVDKAPGDACWLWTASRNPKGYGQFHFRDRSTHSHRVAWELTYGPIPEGMWCLHHCDNPSCVRPDHLFLGTAADNTADMMSKGRHGGEVFPAYKIAGDRHWTRRHPENILKGEDIGTSRLTEQQVLEIRAKYAAGEFSKASLAREYGVVHHTIRSIIARKSWRHI